MHMQQSYKKRPGLSGVDTAVRKVSPTFGKVVFLTHAHKSRGTLAVESDAERLVSNILGFEPAARTYEPQPFTIDLVDGTILRTSEQRKAARAKHKGRQGALFYTPDFAVTWSGRTNEALEVKLDQYMGGPDYDEKLTLAASILWAHGYLFSRVVVPSYWKHPLRMNIPLLHQATMRKDLCPEQEIFERIELLAQAGAQTLRDYCTGLSLSPNMAPVLLAFGALSMDFLRHPISGDAPAVPAFGSLDHLELVRRLAK
jgi:hypothetical protein